MNVYEKLLQVQLKLDVPKRHYNDFGNYYYRKCEDILDAVKPLLNEVKAVLYLSDEIKGIGERNYVEATATLVDLESGDTIVVTASAREDAEKKKMDGSQLTGASSSYARKYALNGLFNIDDVQDSDTTNKGVEQKKQVNYRDELISLIDKNGLDIKTYAVEHGLDGNTTQDEFKKLCEEFKNEPYYKEV